ncbi:O-antigen ligase family protein [Oceanibium sediminis]|uniref:O-antigen ligase family protein n=1 Tax=Oceanibium sediminis TaxID=2026339 RepID=UPI000DD2E6ED|nr:O-antigen ligase family protein [Oceanibium sediminis]
MRQVSAPATTTDDRQKGAGWPDVVIGVCVILWMAEATARLPFQGAWVATIYAVVLCRMLLRSSAILGALPAAAPALPFVALCLLSSLWSPVPEVSLIAGVQLAFTVLCGAWLGQTFGLGGLARLLTLALILGMIGSALNLAGLSAPTHAREGGFLGIYLNKNALGQRAALLVWTLVFLLQTSPRPAARLGWACGLALAIWMLVLSASVSSWAMALAGGGALVLLGVRRRGGTQWRILAVGLATLATAAAVALLMSGTDPVVWLLEATGKDATLTGRTLLWSIAWEEARAAPLSGLGYMAFWADPAKAQDVMLIRLMFGPMVSAFHNFLLETLVALGPGGVAAMLGFLGLCAARLWRLGAGAARSWAMVSLLAFVTLSALGSSLFRPHEITLLLVTALLVAAGAPRRAHERRRAYSRLWRPMTASQ